jgi:hypothetical protein
MCIPCPYDRLLCSKKSRYLPASLLCPSYDSTLVKGLPEEKAGLGQKGRRDHFWIPDRSLSAWSSTSLSAAQESMDATVEG